MTVDYRWDDLRFFLAVWRKGSFTAAGAELGVEQSTVSRRIAALERTLGGVLFDRSPAGPVATELAHALVARAERTEREARGLLEASQARGREVRGRVRLATVESFVVQVLLPSVLPELLALHPGLQLDLRTSERTAELSRREADLALRFHRPEGAELVARRLAVLPTAVLAHPDHLRGRTLRADALDWVVLGLPEGESADEGFVRAHVGVPPRIRATGHLTQVEAVRAGLGAALLTRALRRVAPELVEVDLGLPATPEVELWLVAPRGLRRVARVAAVWSFLEARLPGLLREGAAE